MKQNKGNKKQHNKFHKIAKYIVSKNSPSTDDKENAMAVQDEADAIDQNLNRNTKLKHRDPKIKYLA